jgi:hypothetical protein
MLVTLVSYCSYERGYLDALLRNARQFSDLVVLCVGTRLYTGEPEDLASAASRVCEEDEHAGLSPVVTALYEVRESALATPVVLHNAAREAGVDAARRWTRFEPFWALLLDGDEVPDGPRVRAWWRGAGGEAVRVEGPRGVHKMANYWAFLSPRLVARPAEDSVLLVHSDLLTRDALRHPRERDGVYLWHQASPLGAAGLRVARDVRGDDGQPLFWHFSWVRLGDDSGAGDGDGGRAALKAKVRNWGHRDDRDWAGLIDAAFDALDLDAGAAPTHDFVHGYELRLLDRTLEVLL